MLSNSIKKTKIRFAAEKKIKVDDAINELEANYDSKRSQAVSRQEKEIEHLEVVKNINEFKLNTFFIILYNLLYKYIFNYSY